MALLPLDEAQGRLLDLIRPLAIETVPLTEATGRWLAADVIAQRDQPATDLAAMDGYAFRHADAASTLAIIGESAAGQGFAGSLSAGQAVRIFTGAAVPPGADTVVMQEDCSREGDTVRVTGDVPPKGRHIRLKGNDFSRDNILASTGEMLTPGHIGLIAMGGHGSVTVRRRARVAIISTGDELVPPGEATDINHIPASNGVMLKAALENAGAQADDFGLFPDRLEDITAALDRARGHDVIVTIGGASVGDLDLVQPALASAGATLDFLKVALKPGKPLMAGRLDDALVIGLPGNPVSAFVSALMFLLPAVRAMMGSASPLPAEITIPCLADLPPGGSRTEFVRATMVDGMARPLVNQDSAALAALAQAELLIRRDVNAPAVTAGDRVKAVRLD